MSSDGERKEKREMRSESNGIGRELKFEPLGLLRIRTAASIYGTLRKKTTCPFHGPLAIPMGNLSWVLSTPLKGPAMMAMGATLPLLPFLYFVTLPLPEGPPK